jgi:hypothetical protein
MCDLRETSWVREEDSSASRRDVEQPTCHRRAAPAVGATRAGGARGRAQRFVRHTLAGTMP